MEPLLVRCLFCGPFEVPAEVDQVQALHEHAMSQQHRSMILLNAELDEAIHPSRWQP